MCGSAATQRGKRPRDDGRRDQLESWGRCHGRDESSRVGRQHGSERVDRVRTMGLEDAPAVLGAKDSRWRPRGGSDEWGDGSRILLVDLPWSNVHIDEGS